MVVKISIVVFFTCLAVVLSKPADNPIDVLASNIPGLDAVQGGLRSVNEDISNTYKEAQDTVGEAVNSFQKVAEKGMEAGMNAAKTGVKIFTSPLDIFRNIAGNFGK